MNSLLREKTKAITKSGLTIYDSLKNAPNLFLTNDELESILAWNLQGLNLAYKLRTRSKVLKTKVCEALGYPVPKSFKKAQPRFIGQDFDTYIQKSNNLQIWNEKISPTRRYVLVRLNDRDVVTSVKVITGEAIAKYDKTGTLTSKFQARRKGVNDLLPEN